MAENTKQAVIGLFLKDGVVGLDVDGLEVLLTHQQARDVASVLYKLADLAESKINPQ